MSMIQPEEKPACGLMARPTQEYVAPALGCQALVADRDPKHRDEADEQRQEAGVSDGGQQGRERDRDALRRPKGLFAPSRSRGRRSGQRRQFRSGTLALK